MPESQRVSRFEQRAGSLPHGHFSTKSTFFVAPNETHGAMEKPQIAILKRRLKAQEMIDQGTDNKFDLSQVMYPVSHVTAKNLIGAQTVRHSIMQTKLPQIDPAVTQRATLGTTMFKLAQMSAYKPVRQPIIQKEEVE
jgi:hypothetical protein